MENNTSHTHNKKDMVSYYEYKRKQRTNFKKTHIPRVCGNCYGNIQPGDDIITVYNNDKVFCCSYCFVEYFGGEPLIYDEEDEQYTSLFKESK